MAITITPNPTYPIPARPAEVSFTATGGGNYVKLYCTAAPLDSELRGKLDALETGTATPRVQVWRGDIVDRWTWTPDNGGKYTFAAEEITKGATTHGGGYLDDPDGYQTETIIGTTTGLTVSVGSRLSGSIGAGGDTATLAFYVFGSTVRATTLAQHDEATPALSDPTTPRARTAAESATVVAALAALSGETATSILGTPSAIAASLIAEFNDHLSQAGVHAADDADNAVAVSLEYSPGSPGGTARAANELRLRLSRHMTNDAAGAGIGTGAYHAIGGIARADQLHALVMAGASEQDPLATCLMLADLWRAYEAHRVDTNYHLVADSTNQAASLDELLILYREFLAALQAASPTAPATENSGAVLLVHSGGLKAG